MKNKNNSGMTLVEVLVSLIIISLVMSLLFTLLLQLQKINGETQRKTSLLLAQNVITKSLEQDLIETGIKKVSSCKYTDFGISSDSIDLSEEYGCFRFEFNESYDIADVGYLLIYKQNASVSDASWVIKYSKGYYSGCIANQPIKSDQGSSWIESYSVVQKLDKDIELDVETSKATVTYEANYDSTKKYGDQTLNMGNIFIPIQDRNGYSYNLDLTFSFLLDYKSSSFNFDDALNNFACINSGNVFCSVNSTSNIGDITNKLVGNSYNSFFNSDDTNVIYYCAEGKESTGSVIGMNKNFIDLNDVALVGIKRSNVKTVGFYDSKEFNSAPFSNPIDVSYSKNGTTLMYYKKNDVSPNLYDLYFVQEDGVSIYGKSLGGMFKNFSNLETINFNNFISTSINNMSSMFYGCSKLTNVLNFFKLDFSSVVDMSNIFNKCSSLTVSPFNEGNYIERLSEYDVSKFKRANLTSVSNASYAFANSGIVQFVYGIDFPAYNVKNLDNFLKDSSSLQKFYLADINEVKYVENLGENVEETVISMSLPLVTTMRGLLSGCANTTDVYFANLNLPKLITIEFAFEYNSKLVSSSFINVSTPVLESIKGLYFGDSSLRIEGIDFTNFSTSTVKDFGYLFSGTTSFRSVDLSFIDFSNATSINRMFNGSGITYVKFGDEGTGKGNLSNVKDAYAAFANTSNFLNFEGDLLVLNNALTLQLMFYNCAISQEARDKDFDISFLEPKNGINFNQMFSYSGFRSIDISGIHSEVPNYTNIFLNEMFSHAPNLQYVFIQDAMFKGNVNMNSTFSECQVLNFVGFDASKDENIDNYLAGAGDYVYKNGKSPFYNFTDGDGYVYDLSSCFLKDSLLRGFVKGYLDDIHTKTNTNLASMFNGAFSKSYSLNIPLSGEEYKKVHYVYFPFKGIYNTVGSANWSIFEGCKNLAVIEFNPNTFKSVETTQSFYNIFYNVGTHAAETKKIDEVTIILNDLNFVNSTNASRWTTIIAPGDLTFLNNNLKVKLQLSNNCDTARKQREFTYNSFSEEYKNQVTYVSDGCPSVNKVCTAGMSWTNCTS